MLLNKTNFLKPGKYMRISGFTIPHKFNGLEVNALWYIKKWITFYYYISEQKIDFNDSDKKEIYNNFDQFINSIPLEDEKDDAETFFYTPNIEGDNVNLIPVKQFMGDSEKNNDYLKYVITMIGRKVNLKTKKLILNGEIGSESIDTDYSSTARSDLKFFKFIGLIDAETDSLTHYGKIVLNGNFEVVRTVYEYLKVFIYADSYELPNLKFKTKPTSNDIKDGNVDDSYNEYFTIIIDSYKDKNDFAAFHTFIYKVFIEYLHTLKKKLIPQDTYKYIVSRVAPYDIDKVEEILDNHVDMDTIKSKLDNLYGDNGPDQKDFDKFIYGNEEFMKKYSGIRITDENIFDLISPCILNVYKFLEKKYSDEYELISLYRENRSINEVINLLEDGVKLGLVNNNLLSKYREILNVNKAEIKKYEEENFSYLKTIETLSEKYLYIDQKLRKIDKDIFIKVYSYTKLIDLYKIVSTLDNKAICSVLYKEIRKKPEFKPLRKYLNYDYTDENYKLNFDDKTNLIGLYLFIYYVYKNPFTETKELESLRISPSNYIAEVLSLKADELEELVVNEIHNIIEGERL
ncbi:MAG: hypothetical protein ACOCRK_06005 [bacterium]